MKIEAGDEIVSRYLIEGRLGVGGMSTVMLAVDQRLDRRVAVKLLAEHLADDSTFVSRFRREALAAARLVHPNIVQVFDFGFDPELHQHFIVMEYVPGRSCAQVLRDRGHLDVDETVDIVAQACNGLDYAHHHGVIHRDVKPGNLMISESGVVKLADFGIARATGQSAITQVGSVLGTAAYLSPEQARGEEAGPYADLYSLGVVAYQLLAGRLPYEASSLSELALKQQRERPVPIDRINRDVSTSLADAIALTISIDPTERPVDAMAFAALVERGADGISPSRARRRDPEETAATRVQNVYDGPTDATLVDSGRREPPPRAKSRTNQQRPAPRQREVPRASAAEADRYRQGGREDEYRDQPKRKHKGLRRLAILLALVAIVVIAIIVVGAIKNNAGTAVRTEHFVIKDWQSGMQTLQSLVSKYSSN